MTKRRKLPAPPLVLTPYLARFPKAGEEAERLLRLARFLRRRGLLTHGGAKSLESGLEGRNGVVSLGLQDVRACAHGLVVELLREPSGDRWETVSECYFRRYDRGKPRRPTHLQRLYLEWSSNLSWTGLLRTLRDHPGLWGDLQIALERLEEDTTEARMLRLALACRENPSPWVRAFEDERHDRRGLLELLPLLSSAPPEWRVPYLASWAREHRVNPEDNWTSPLIRACHCGPAAARELRRLPFDRGVLEAPAVVLLERERSDPIFICAFRAFATEAATVDRLFRSIGREDPLRRVAFGPRPGRNWLESLQRELLALIELR